MRKSELQGSLSCEKVSVSVALSGALTTFGGPVPGVPLVPRSTPGYIRVAPSGASFWRVGSLNSD
ncbi:MAG: hypothetical protein AMXMBFR82_02980 [Candidatus Hydrogenedentota bacterium]